jgi:hypothetical protein
MGFLGEAIGAFLCWPDDTTRRRSRRLCCDAEFWSVLDGAAGPQWVILARIRDRNRLLERPQVSESGRLAPIGFSGGLLE